MEKINVWDTDENMKFTYFYTIEQLIENINKRKITNISVKKEYIPGTPIETLEENIFLKRNIHAIYTDENHPVCLTKFFKHIIVGPIFFEKYKNEITEALKKNALENNYVTINKHLYSDEFVRQIIENNEDVQITFVNITPSDNIITLLKEKHIESYLEINDQREKISTKYAFEYYTFKSLDENDKITIESDITEEEINNIKYCKENTIIHIENRNLEEVEYLNNVKKILDSVEDKNLIIKFDCEKRSNLEKSGILNNNFKNLNIIVNNDFYDYPFEEYKKEEQRLNEMVKDIKESNMTPFEKYIAVYDIVKNYKEYKEDEEDKNQSRYLRNILDNEYMVCVGYAKLLETLLDKVGIESTIYSLGVDISYDEGFTEEEIPLNHAGHARLMVHLQDETYGIDGFYISDPTWDNNLEDDLYGNLLMPMDYMQKSNRLFKLQILDYVFDVHSLEEYKIKISILIRRELNKIKPKTKEDFDKDKYSDIEIRDKIEEKYKRDIAYRLSSIYHTTVDQIKKLDYNKYLELKDLYKDLNTIPYETEKIENYIDSCYNFFAEISPYIVSKSNKELPRKTIVNAITQSKLKTSNLLPQNVEEFQENLEESLETNDIENRPYEFPDNYLSDTDDGVTIISRHK